MQEGTVEQFETRIWKGLPAVDVERTHRGQSAHRRGRRAVGDDHVLGHERAEAIGVMRVVRLERALRRLLHERLLKRRWLATGCRHRVLLLWKSGGIRYLVIAGGVAVPAVKGAPVPVETAVRSSCLAAAPVRSPGGATIPCVPGVAAALDTSAPAPVSDPPSGTGAPRRRRARVAQSRF
jgi:hypothetical protein